MFLSKVRYAAVAAMLAAALPAGAQVLPPALMRPGVGSPSAPSTTPGSLPPGTMGSALPTMPGQMPGQMTPSGVGPAPGVDALLNRNDPLNMNRVGAATAAEAGAIAVGPLGDPNRIAGPATAVFGASLFTRGAPSPTDAPNPNYVIQVGDRISVTLWGFVEGNIVGSVDNDGNIFVPQVGPVRVAGVRAGDIQRIVAAEVGKIYAQQVQVYAMVMTTGQVGIFVTGFVRMPGRHTGTAAETVLDYLSRAGGVDPGRGSYRDIQVRRGGQTIARIDLYRFLLTGQLPEVQMQLGDTIIVAAQGAVVGADGAVRNNYLFEVSGRTMSGGELIRLASPLPSATNAVIRGTRNSQPFARYVSLRELNTVQLLDQDTVSFITDAPPQTVRVSVEGSRIGPSVLIAARDTTLCTLLDYVEVDPRLADTRGVFILRPGLAQAQQRTINEAMDRLERQMFLTQSTTTGVAEVRASEANLVLSYIQRARRVQPEGRLVVMDRSGRCADVRVQDGDTIVIPEKQETVLVSGEVRAPQAVVWRPTMRLDDFVRAAGGYAERGEGESLMIRKPSGELVIDPTEAPQPGDELIALPRLDPKNFQLTRDLFNLIFQSALSARVFFN
ncbi:polysaccharide biosynthesis/export family protein [Falsiroseomonas sp. HW251]|uniref:polysaccharide biosynthesis/export family protein n=1 Tax=Falsiroseomonas sp. HW251 TaxID=3390998 RepID=UPI003D317B84